MALAEMEGTHESDLKWKSPMRKLVRVFETSRNNWKSKHKKLKRDCKLLGNQVRAVEKSRQKWRRLAVQAQQEAQRLRQELEEYKKSAA